MLLKGHYPAEFSSNQNKKKLEPANQSLQNNSKLPRKCAGLIKLCKTLGHLQEQDWIPLTLGFGWLVSLTVVRRRKELKRSSHVVAALRKASCLRISCSTSSTLPPSSLLLSKGSWAVSQASATTASWANWCTSNTAKAKKNNMLGSTWLHHLCIMFVLH